MRDSSANGSEGMCGSAPLLVGLSIGLYTFLCLVVFVAIRRANQGHFVFSLDDPYIHLALADQIAHGHYGINAGEAASPSSSLIWPPLLALFARTSWQSYTALGLNFLAGLGAAAVLGWNVASWPQRDRTLEEHADRVVSVGLLVVIGNLVGLTFIGMEHTLQVLLAACCATGVIFCVQGRRVPTWCVVAAALGPLVRYESLSLSVALAVALAGRKDWKRAAGLMVASTAPLLAFSIFLRELGLPMLPSSVLLKGGAAAPGQSVLSHLVRSMALSLRLSIAAERRVLLILFLTLAGLAWSQRERGRRFALAGAAGAAGLHLLAGPFGWFHRYEVYIVLFSVLVVLYVLHERPRILLGWYVLGLFMCATPYIDALRHTVDSSNDVYLQQYQMHRFVTQFYSGNVAVNDLGLVSYRRRPGEEVVDLFGLASAEAAQQRNRSTQWMDSITREHDVGLVMIYDGWFPRAPKDWAELGQLCLVRRPIILGGRCVTYYATPAAPLTQVRREFESFVRTLPAGVRVVEGKKLSETCWPLS
ncbi:MAG: hypothetical protein ACP5E5_07345 [Acidobacteriaceae bacterium]